MKAEYEWSRFNCPPLDGMIADDLIYRMAVEHLQSELHCAQFQKRKKTKQTKTKNPMKAPMWGKGWRGNRGRRGGGGRDKRV